MDKIGEIMRLKSLLDQGAITIEEFFEVKKKIISNETYAVENHDTDPQTSTQSKIIDEATNVPETSSKKSSNHIELGLSGNEISTRVPDDPLLISDRSVIL